MTSRRLQNYLLSNRKRLALSQDEVAFLLGTPGGAKVSRYERCNRRPNLETALAYEAIFQKPVRELFAGLYEKRERQVLERAKVLTYRIERRKGAGQSARRRQALTEIAARSAKSV